MHARLILGIGYVPLEFLEGIFQHKYVDFS